MAEDPAPYFQHHVFVCVNQRPADDPRGCCSAKGAVVLRNYMKQRAKESGLKGVRINGAQCLDRCELGPTLVIYPEGIWYHYRTKEDLDEILEVHLKGGGRVDRLMMRPEWKELADTPWGEREAGQEP
jgi:(2Fe-2S) ferredoxin